MGCGSGSNTTVSSNSPPPEFLKAYQETYGQAKNVAGQPLSFYPGPYLADFTQPQRQAFDQIAGLQGASDPFIQRAQDYLSSATQPLSSSITQVDPTILSSLAPNAISQGFGSVSNYKNLPTLSNDTLRGAVGRGFGLSDASLMNLGRVPSYSAGALDQYMNPFTQSVVDATQRQFNDQNQRQQQQLIGDAVKSGAWGGDRSAVAQGVLAGQQRLAQDPVIAGLYSQGFGQAQNQFNTQQQLELQRALQQSQLQQSAANQGFGLYGQGLGAALQQAAGQTGAQQGLAQQWLNFLQGQQQTQLGAAQWTDWLRNQAAALTAGLGQQKVNTGLTTANALAGVGGLQQQQAQQLLNIPYQQWQAQQAYPFQTTGWLSNIAQGLGGASGSTQSTTQPAPSALSQIGGLGLGAAGLIGGTGGFGSNGWLSGLFGGGGGGASSFASSPFDFATGGRIARRAPGGPISGFGIDSAFGSDIPTGTPDVSISVVPAPNAARAPSFMKRNWGTTQTTTGGGGGFLGPLGNIAMLGAKLAFLRDGGVPGFAEGGNPDVSFSIERTPMGDVAGHPVQGLTPHVLINGKGIPEALHAAQSGQGSGTTATPARTSNSAPSSYYPMSQWIIDQTRAAGLPTMTNGVPWADPGDPAFAGIPATTGGMGTPMSGFGYSGDGGAARGGSLRRFAAGGYDDPDDDDVEGDAEGAEGEEDPTDTYQPQGIDDSGGGEQAADTQGFGQAANAPAPSQPSMFGRSGPWLPLMQAGFAMAAGRSPNALANVGAGALVGAQAVQRQRQIDAVEDARRARTDAYYQSIQEKMRHNMATEDASNRRIDSMVDAARKRLSIASGRLGIAAENAATNRERLRQERYSWQPGQGLDQEGNQVSGSWRYSTRGDEDPQFFPGVLQQRTTSAANRQSNADREFDRRVTQMQQTQDYRDAQAELKKSGMSDANQRALLGAAARIVAADIRGKKTLAQAMDEARGAMGAGAKPGPTSDQQPPAQSLFRPGPTRGDTSEADRQMWQARQLEAARQAIKSGKSRAAVEKMLRDNGIDPAGLQ